MTETSDQRPSMADQIFDAIETSQRDRGGTPNFTYEDAQKAAEAISEPGGIDREWLAGMIAAFLSGARGMTVLKPWPEVGDRLVAWLDERQLLVGPARICDARRIRAVLSDPMLDEAAMLDQVNAILDESQTSPTPQPIAAVGEEPLEPLVSTAARARIRPLPGDEIRAELDEAQRAARFWQGQAEHWEREHQNTVLPYTAELEAQVAALRTEVDESDRLYVQACEANTATTAQLNAVQARLNAVEEERS